MTSFTPFQLFYKLEVVLPIECEISSLKLDVELPNNSIEEEDFLYLTNLYETRWDVTLANKLHMKQIKDQYDKLVQPRVFQWRRSGFDLK